LKIVKVEATVHRTGTPPAFATGVEHDAIDIFMPNSMYNGGVTETRRVAGLAHIYNRALSDAGGGGVFSLHHVAEFAHGTLAEVHLGADQVEHALFVKAPEPEGDRTAIPDAPGWGVALDRETLRETQVVADAP
jgi:L-rhamnonate dehydratase